MADYTPIQILSFNLQEKSSPFFDEEDLQLLLDKNGGDINKASYEGCLLKSQNDSISLSGIDIPDNENYWLRLAKKFQDDIDEPIKNSMRRVDEP